MLSVFPFRALIPSGGNAPSVASLPYDVMNRSEARKAVEGRPLSYLRVTLSDLEFPDDVSSYDERVYMRAAENFRNLCSSGVLVEDPAPSFYVYSLVMNSRRQTGIVGCFSVYEYDAGDVRRHEFTRKEKEDDRTRHFPRGPRRGLSSWPTRMKRALTRLSRRPCRRSLRSLTLSQRMAFAIPAGESPRRRRGRLRNSSRRRSPSSTLRTDTTARRPLRVPQRNWAGQGSLRGRWR